MIVAKHEKQLARHIYMGTKIAFVRVYSAWAPGCKLPFLSNDRSVGEKRMMATIRPSQSVSSKHSLLHKWIVCNNIVNAKLVILASCQR